MLQYVALACCDRLAGTLELIQTPRKTKNSDRAVSKECILVLCVLLGGDKDVHKYSNKPFQILNFLISITIQSTIVWSWPTSARNYLASIYAGWITLKCKSETSFVDMSKF